MNFLIKFVPTNISNKSIGGALIFFDYFGFEIYGAIVPVQEDKLCYTLKIGLIIVRLNIGLTFNLIMEDI